MSAIVKMTHAQWVEEGKRRFGTDTSAWRFVCPCCKRVTAAAEWRAVDAENSIAFSCIGRWTGAKREAFGEGEGPCNYAGGGLFQLNPVHVDFEGRVHQVFAFAEPADA